MNPEALLYAIGSAAWSGAHDGAFLGAFEGSLLGSSVGLLLAFGLVGLSRRLAAYRLRRQELQEKIDRIAGG